LLDIDMGNEPGESEQEVGGHLYLGDPPPFQWRRCGIPVFG
jgi:hypothetical protein